MNSSFAGKMAFVTGAGSGMGREVAMLLAQRGAKVAACDLDAGAAAGTIAALGAARGECYAARLDVTDSNAVNAAVAEATDRFGRIDLVANIAGIYQVRTMEEITDEDWARMFAVHVNGMFHVCRAVIGGMVARRSGAIVNMSSIHAVRGQANAVHYSAAKGAIMGLTKGLAREKGPYNVRVNAVAPGPVDTPLWQGGRSGAELESVKIERSKIIPLGRIAQPSEVARAILFLLSDDASFITGQVIPIDGGESMA